MAGFGESLTTTGPITGEVVYVGRGCDPAYQAGQPLDPYLADPAGRIALIDRGSCTFVAKVKKAQDLGALMVIVANNAPGPAIAMGGADPTITIPSVMVTLGRREPVQGQRPVQRHRVRRHRRRARPGLRSRRRRDRPRVRPRALEPPHGRTRPTWTASTTRSRWGRAGATSSPSRSPPIPTTARLTAGASART